jgi:hypothetical protein
VRLIDLLCAHRRAAHEHAMWHCEDYRLSDVAHVEEVLDRARTKARPDNTFVVYVEQLDAWGTGLVRLWGTDPNSAS